MSQFLSKLVLDDEDGFPMTLVEPLVYQSDLLGTTITVPAGFKTDLASIPQILWSVLPKVGRWDKPAVIHDYLYQLSRGLSRSAADGALREAMIACDVQRRRRWEIYYGVRAGGWLTWRRYRGVSSD